MDWFIVQNADETIPYIEAILKDETISINDFEREIDDFVKTLLFKVVGEKLIKYFYRFHFAFLNGNNIKGEYWLPAIDSEAVKFRVSPIFVEENVSFSPYSEQLIAIDMEVYAVDKTHGYETAFELKNRISAILSFLLDVGIYEYRIEHKYFAYTDDSEGIKTIYKKGFTNFRDPLSEILSKMPSKDQYSSAGLYGGTLIDHIGRYRESLQFPQLTRKIIKYFQQCDPQIKNGFENACHLYQLSLLFGRYHPTVKAAYLYACVDCLSKIRKSRYNNFSTFVIHYHPSIDEGLLLVMHDNRSAHWHSGKFKMGEHEYKWDTLLDYKHNYNRYLDLEIHATVRIVFNNWISEMMKKKIL